MSGRLAVVAEVAREALREDNRFGTDWPAERGVRLRAALMRVAAVAGAQELPARRRQETRSVVWRGRELHVSATMAPGSSQMREVAVHGAPVGSDLQLLCDDLAAVLSLALQAGVSAGQLRRLTGTVPILADGVETEEPASLVGAVLRAVEAMELKR